jgi:hypothetical protein
VGDDIIERLRPFIEPGARQMPPPFTDSVLVTAKMPSNCGPGFIVYRKPDIPLVVCTMAVKPSQHAPTWKHTEKLYFTFTDTPNVARMDWESPHEPTELPWLAVILTGTPEDMIEASEWLGDFERCLAWTILEYKE